MDRLRRPESFDDVSAEGLFRATTVPAILAKQGAIFMQGLPGLLEAGGLHSAMTPTKQEVLQAGSFIFDSSSRANSRVDVFVSHCWSSGRWKKFLALCLYFNLAAAVLCSLTAWLLAIAGMIAYAHGEPGKLGGNHLLLPILVHFPIVVFLVVLIFGQHAVHCLRPISMWVDRACIHQTDLDFKHRQIQALPVFVARSSSMVVLWDDEYFSDRSGHGAGQQAVCRRLNEKADSLATRQLALFKGGFEDKVRHYKLCGDWAALAHRAQLERTAPYREALLDSYNHPRARACRLIVGFHGFTGMRCMRIRACLCMAVPSGAGEHLFGGASLLSRFNNNNNMMNTSGSFGVN
ncbi:unnamed protein product [Symbiodinium sp. CCMP2456]|nr:unnamed protein product [Symbiodinium sp. CCMP2456]